MVYSRVTLGATDKAWMDLRTPVREKQKRLKSASQHIYIYRVQKSKSSYNGKLLRGISDQKMYSAYSIFTFTAFGRGFYPEPLTQVL